MAEHERLKVLFITAWYPTKEQPVGGVFVREHAKAVRLYDDVVVLHCAGVNPEMKRLWRLEQETDQSLTEGIPTYRVWHRRSPIPKTSYFFHIWSALQAFRYILAHHFRPDVIHAHVYSAGVPSVLLGRLYRVPVVITEHSTSFPMRELSKTAVAEANIAFRLAQRVCPVSNFLLNAIKAYGIKANFEVIPNVVDISRFYAKTRVESLQNKQLVYVGILQQSRKGVDQLLFALSLLQKKRCDFHLHIVGDGPRRSEYENIVRDLGLERFVTFHGRISTDLLASLLRKSHVFILPSLFENFSVAAAEALATGTPVLATRCGGPEEFINDDVGILVPPGDVEALCEGIDYMLNNLQRFQPDRISQYASERFSPQKIGGLIHRIYMQLIE
jgi:glycosyltransferase involved in cell wall biosynthesis